MRPEVGQLINGKYRLTRLIGEGGMGSVFEATHEYLGSSVALKFLNPLLAERDGLRARFLQEARVSASIRSPHVVQVSDVDQTPLGLPYLVMELLEGESLQQTLNQHGRLPLGTALEYAAQILNGLEVAHARSIVHRDLKPDNVFIVPTPQGPLLKLLDFGIAKLKTTAESRGLTRHGAVMGTPEYMSPEQATSADTADHRSDLYAAGVILFEMISGVRPVDVDEPHVMAAMVMSGRMRRLADVVPSVPTALSDAVARALAGRPDDRFASAAEMRGAILPFFTASAQASGIANYPSMVAVTPPMPPVKHGTAVLSAPAAPSDRPAPTQPGTDPDVHRGGITATLPPEEPMDHGRTGTVLGAGMGPGFADPYGPTNAGEFGATAEMPPLVEAGPPPAYAAPTKKSSGAWTVIGILAGALGALAAAAVIGYFVITQEDGPDEPSSLPTIGPPSTVTADQTGALNTSTVTPPIVPTSPTTPPVTATNTTPPRRDAGAPDAGGFDAGFPQFPDASIPIPPFPSSLPSGFIPPFPIPSGLPTIPIPGWPPPPNP